MIVDLHIQFDSDSPESRIIESVANREQITPEEAVQAILRRAAEENRLVVRQADPLWGLLRDDPETADAIEHVALERRQAYAV